MQDLEALKAQVKKLNQQATALKMDLHDLSEDLPTGWEKIPDLAKRTYEVHSALSEARKGWLAPGLPDAFPKNTTRLDLIVRSITMAIFYCTLAVPAANCGRRSSSARSTKKNA